jgi:protein-tyrosine-phosphatase
MSSSRPHSVLFACTYNRTRSPMAESLARLELGDDVRVASCGTRPLDETDYFMLSALQEVGAHRPERPGQGFEVLDDEDFDLVIAMTEDSYAAAQKAAQGRGVDVEHWPTPDPTLAEGSREQVMDAYRAFRDQLRRRIRDRFAE